MARPALVFGFFGLVSDVVRFLVVFFFLSSGGAVAVEVVEVASSSSESLLVLGAPQIQFLMTEPVVTGWRIRGDLRGVLGPAAPSGVP